MFTKNVFLKSLVAGSLALCAFSNSASAQPADRPAINSIDLSVNPGGLIFPYERLARGVDAMAKAAKVSGMGVAYVFLDADGDVLTGGRLQGASGGSLERANLAAEDAYAQENGEFEDFRERREMRRMAISGNASVASVKVNGDIVGYLAVVASPTMLPPGPLTGTWKRDAQDAILKQGLNGIAGSFNEPGAPIK